MEAILEAKRFKFGTEALRAKFERDSRGQASGELFHEIHRDSLSASNFFIATRRNSTLCHNHVKLVLGEVPDNEAMRFGRAFEDRAVEKYKTDYKVKIEKCGTFIDPETLFLIATPDRLIGDDTILEVKCLYSLRECETLDESKVACPEKLPSGNGYRLRRSDKWYHQIQGQLFITGRQICVFLLYNRREDASTQKVYENVWLEEVVCDDAHWAKYKPKLIKFYEDCLYHPK